MLPFSGAIQKARYFAKTCAAIGCREAATFAAFRQLDRQRVRSVAMAGERLALRTATSDLEVALSCLVDKEFEHLALSNPAVILDAGAYIGTSALYFARRFPGATVFALEPEAENYRLLCANVAAHPNIVPIRAALWGHDERRTIRARRTGAWGYTMVDAQGSAPTDQAIDCVTVGTLIEKYGWQTIDLLKMDIEGAELAVFETAGAWIGKTRSITVELHDRIIAGCERSFRRATVEFSRFERHGEKVTAYRD